MSREPQENGRVVRQSFRLDPGILRDVDRLRRMRTGFVSRNTWIMEAILEKLAREKHSGDATGDRGGNVHVL